jgi:hypothetical protein
MSSFVEPALSDFCVFARAQLDSGDIDPMYPVLRTVYDIDSLDLEARLWRTLIYVTWYHIGSAHRVWEQFPTWREFSYLEVTAPEISRIPVLPTGIERRGFRGPAGAAKAERCLSIAVHRALDRTRGSLGSNPDQFVLATWINRTASAPLRPDESVHERHWRNVRIEFEQVPGNGPWASYKWCDLLTHVHGLDMTAPDIGVGGGSVTAGPVPGMMRVTGESAETCATDIALQKSLLTECRFRGVPFTGLEQLETALCDFNSLCKGHYYVGHDIDMMMTQLHELPSKFWFARGQCFPTSYLGEAGGWSGVRPKLKTVYRDTGRIEVPL